ncbi:MAG: CDP-diacylglycerol O-phosphatidyltransferase [Gammaproteobacteria bacterium]|nr:MAG: CDP-diacylglycerol O-phosphatidyltransferase [Gammaproteobacteria bacterium]
MLKPRPYKKIALAYGVHLFTVMGLLLALIATWCISQGVHQDAGWIRLFFIFMMLCVFVDAVDGTMARKFEVKKYTPHIDGALLDNMIDYITFAFLPGYFILVSNVIENNFLSITAVSFIIVSASYQFCRTDAKIADDDHYFVGFPSYWNIVVAYLYWLELSEWTSFLVVFVLAVLSFVPLKWVYPSRTKFWLKLTAPLMLVYSVAIFYETLFHFEQPHQWFINLSYFVFAYYTLLSLYLNFRSNQAAKAAG